MGSDKTTAKRGLVISSSDRSHITFFRFTRYLMHISHLCDYGSRGLAVVSSTWLHMAGLDGDAGSTGCCQVNYVDQKSNTHTHPHWDIMDIMDIKTYHVGISEE